MSLQQDVGGFDIQVLQTCVIKSSILTYVIITTHVFHLLLIVKQLLLLYETTKVWLTGYITRISMQS